MTRAAAWQYIFSNVEKEQSPNRRRGFQTLFASRPALSPEDEVVLSTWANGFPQLGQSEKFQYFPLSDGRRVVSRIVPLPELDRFGRSGRFLAHSLVFSADDWRMLNGDPFRVISSGAFFSSVSEALEHGDFDTGGIAPVEIDWPPEEFHSPRPALDDPARTGLLRLAWACLHRSHPLKKPLAIPGAIEPVLALLGEVFALLPISARQECFFDSAYDDCDTSQLPVFLAGFIKPPPDGLIVVHPDLLDAARLPAPAPVTEFERWWTALALAGRFETIRTSKQAAEAMQHVIAGRASPQERLAVEQADDGILAEFMRLNSEAIHLAAQDRLAMDFSAGLAARLLPKIESNPRVVWRLLVKGLDTQEAARLVESSLWARLPAYLARDDALALRNLAAGAGSERLALLADYYERVSAPRRWLEVVNTLADDSYEKLLAYFLTQPAADLLALLTPDRAEAWLRRGLPALPDNQLLELGLRLIDFRNTAGLERLAGRLDGMSRDDQIDLKRRLQDNPRLAPGLWDALKTSDPNEGGWLDQFFRHRKGGR